MSCPTLEQHATGELPGPTRTSVETHVASCEDCRRRPAEVQSNVRIGDNLCTPPDDTVSPPAGSSPNARPTRKFGSLGMNEQHLTVGSKKKPESACAPPSLVHIAQSSQVASVSAGMVAGSSSVIHPS